MGGIKQKVQAVLSGEEQGGRLFLFFLYGLSVCYGLAVRFRSFLYDKGILKANRVACKVVSIGNLTVGGTGKTPMTMYVAELLRDSGYQPVVISRGYKGRAEKTGGIVSDGKTILLGPDFAGDEPYMMAQKLKGIPVLIGGNRYKIGLRAIEKFSPDVIVLDDAFQHRQLDRGMDLVLIDEKTFLGNMALLPRGILREPVSGLLRADAFILTRSGGNPTPGREKLKRMVPGKPIFKSYHKPYIADIIKGGDDEPHETFTMISIGDVEGDFEFLKKSTVFVFSGIAKNKEFMSMVEERVKEVAGGIQFADHHTYSKKDFRIIVDQAKKCSAEFLVTTEKDYVKIAGKIISPIDIIVIGIKVSFKDDEKKFSTFIKGQMAQL